MSVLTANINFLASLGITTSEQFTAAFGDMASFTEYCTAIGYSWELDENNDIILITPDGKKVNTYVQVDEKTATPTITVTPGDTEYTFEATGDGTVKLYIDEVEVSNPVAISRTNEAQEVTVTATAQEQGKQISDEAWEEVTIPALSGPSSISFETDHFTIQGNEGNIIESPEFVVITDDLGNDVTEYCNFTSDPDVGIYADQISGSPIYSNGSSPAGTYSVEITAEYNGLTATATVDVDISGPSSISFDQNSYSISAVEGDLGSTSFTITDDLGNAVTYDCTYSFSPNDTGLHIEGESFYTDQMSVGTYSVDVTADYNGLTATATVNVDITSPGPQSISFDQNSYSISAVEGDSSPAGTFTITDDLGNDVTYSCTYSLSPNDTGLYIQDNSFYTDQMSAGTYSVDVTATYDGLTATATVDVDITASQGIYFDNSSYSLSGNEGDTITQTFDVYDGVGEVTSACTFTLSPNDTGLFIEDQGGGVFAFNASSMSAGTYSVDVTADYNGLTATATVNVDIASNIPNYMKLSVVGNTGANDEIEIYIPSDVGTSAATSISYSYDGTNWTDAAVLNQAQGVHIPVSTGDVIYLKGIAQRWGGSNRNNSTNIISTVDYEASGNAMSLFYGDNFEGRTVFQSGSQYNLAYLFAGTLSTPNNHLIDASQLELPATTLTTRCYAGMFEYCYNITTAPELPATTLANSCYNDMFGHSSLTTAPELPATTLANSCYRGMFASCSSLTTAPELPATTLANYCYTNMFTSCTSLTTAPELPATTLANSCYQGMFLFCTRINSITMLANDISATDCLTDWVKTVSSSGTFTKSRYIPESTIGQGNSGIPTGWTVVEPTGEQLMSIETPSTATGYVNYWTAVSFNSVMLQFNDGQGNSFDIAGISDAPGIFTFDPNDKLGLTIDSYSTSGDEIVNGVRLGGSSEDKIEIAANAVGNCMLNIAFGYDGSKITTYHPTCDWQAAGHSTYQDFVDSLPTEIRSYVSQDANNTNLALLDTSYWTGCSTEISIDFTAAAPQ